MEEKTFYEEKIVPLLQELTKKDEGDQEMNFGQSKEVIADLAKIIKNKPETLMTLAEYSLNIKEDSIKEDSNE